MPVVISMPHGCDLKSKTSRERLIGEKYLESLGAPAECLSVRADECSARMPSKLLFEVLEGPRAELSAAAAKLTAGGEQLLSSGLLSSDWRRRP
ncbi:hypothetical protein [Dankookia sp. P2]|uniref:hypothetical protein n=1 Tax=Dankookia sp. P2 TaxID=3423955 RepID=UPI003D66A7A3